MVSRGVVRATPAAYGDLPDDLLLDHMFPKLCVSDLGVLSRVDRRSRGLVKRDTRGDEPLNSSDFTNTVARLRWARDNGCRWDESICVAAAKGGHLEVLQWAREQDLPCSWDEQTCGAAALHGHLELLQGRGSKILHVRGMKRRVSAQLSVATWRF